MVAFGLTVCQLAQPAAAGQLEDGQAAYDKSDYVTALGIWRPLADQGNAAAQYNLGTMYLNGIGVPQDYAEAMKWYRLAADQGLAFAQNNLGIMYEQGLGVPKDYAEALKLFQNSADQGHAPGQYSLAGAYENGHGVEQNLVQALKWYILAAYTSPQVDTEFRGNAIIAREEVMAQLRADEVVEAQRLAREWLTAHQKP